MSSSRKVTKKKSDEAAIKEWHRKYHDSCNRGDLETFKTLLGDDVTWLPPNAPIMKKKACLEMAENLMKNYRINQNPTIEEIKTDADLAYSRISYRETYYPRDEGKPIINDGKGVYLFRRRSDGVWVSTHIIWNSNVA
jgi:ketosteroid isomerase-like protein